MEKKREQGQGLQHPVSLRMGPLCLTMSILGTRAYHAAQPLRKATLQVVMSGPELVLPGTAMRPSCHSNYTDVTTCRGTVRPRTRSVLQALRPLPLSAR